MNPADVALERAAIEGATRALHRRAAALRRTAAGFMTTITDKGREVPIVEPEARIAIGTAELFEQAAADVAALAHG